MLILKEYQQKALTALESYLQRVTRLGDPDTAFYEFTRDASGQGTPFIPVRELPGVPYVCLRLPTGGGKTLLACHSIAVAKHSYLGTDYPLILWLVPSNAIRDQTLAALRDRAHPYRQALDQYLGAVTVLDLTEALHVQRATLDSTTTIIVSTLQAFRVEDTDGRRVYEDNGSLMTHFDGYPVEALSTLECWENGEIVRSLANILALRQPLVIVDEAHNARTELSFTTLSRFRPSAIIEFTATPDTETNPSNVLYAASAAELQAEDMIKMPILLDSRRDWRQLLAVAIERRRYLEAKAQEEWRARGEYLRPIMLLQAEPSYRDRESVTVEVLETTLIDEFSIPAEQVARATGTDRGLDGVDILSMTSPIRYVITVQALREGWDCPFAYVLCSVAESRSSTAIEQILGRLMRLPHAHRKEMDDLNQAYAFVRSAHFAEAATALVDGLVRNGFDPLDAATMVRPEQPVQQDLGPLWSTLGAGQEPVRIVVSAPPDLSRLPASLAAKLSITQSGDLLLREWMSAEEHRALLACYKNHADQKAVNTAYELAQRFDTRTLAEKGETFSLPMLAFRQGAMLEDLGLTHFMEHRWELAQRDASLSEGEYAPPVSDGQQFEIYVSDEGRLAQRYVQSVHQQMRFLSSEVSWTEADLVYWLDRHIPHLDVSPDDSGPFLVKAVQYLVYGRQLEFSQLVQDRYRLAASIAAKINRYRQEARSEALQSFLLPQSPVCVTPELCFTYDPARYPYNRPYQGNYTWAKHYYPVVGDLKSEGEEFECARYLDILEEVKVWVRNPDQSSLAFSLQTTTDRFYPDFVCRLKDGRYLVVEYKGLVYRTNDDSQEKNIIGELWEKRSGGSCLFIMVSDRQYDSIAAKVRGRY